MDQHSKDGSMNEQMIKDLMKPIEDYVQSNRVELNDIHIVVQNFFPEEDKVRQIATYLRENVQALKILDDSKLLERTRQILTNALNSAALNYYKTMVAFDEDEYDIEDWVSESEFDEGWSEPERVDWFGEHDED